MTVKMFNRVFAVTSAITAFIKTSLIVGLLQEVQRAFFDLTFSSSSLINFSVFSLPEIY